MLILKRFHQCAEFNGNSSLYRGELIRLFVQHMQSALGDREPGPDQANRSVRLFLLDARECPQIGKTGLDPFMFHRQPRGGAIQIAMFVDDLRARIVEQGDPVGDKSAFAGGMSFICSDRAAAQPPQLPCPMTTTSSTLRNCTANSSAEETP